MKPNKKFILLILILLISVLIASSISLGWGSYAISPFRIPKILLGSGTKLENITIFSIRLPRILIAIVVGIALSFSGSILQTVTRNDLADSGMIGINAGASLAAVIYITSQTTNYYDELGRMALFVLPFVAMTGSFLSLIVIYLLSNRKGISPQRLILIGIGLNIAINAFITFYSLRVTQGQYNRVLVWTTGSLWGSNYLYFFAVSPLILLFILLSLYQYKTMDVLNLGDEISIGLGIQVDKERKKLLVYAVVLAGLATSVAGNISFLGLISPHIARRLVGPYHKRFMMTGALISVIIIVISDSVSRNLFSPIEIPVGITISLIGVPYFIYLMIKEKS